MADKITNDITLLFKTKLDEKSKQEVGKNLKGLLENAAIGFDEAETKRNLEPIVNMMKKLFDKAEIAFDADKLLSMPSRQALEEMAKMEVDQLQLAFDKALAKSGGVKIDFGDIGLSELAAPLKQIESELSDISRKISDTTKKSVYEIEQSLKSVSKNKAFKKIASPESIENTLIESSNDKKIHPSRAAEQLEKARDLYETSVKEDNPWVVQYKYLLDFVSKYEKLTQQAKTKIETERPEFKQLYDILSPKTGAVKISLEHFVDVARGNELSEYKNQPWGRETTLKQIRDSLKNGITVKEGLGGDQSHTDDSTPPWEDNDGDKAPKKPNTKVPPEDAADVDIAEQLKKKEEERLRLAEKRRIEQEKIAEMLKKEAELAQTPKTKTEEILLKAVEEAKSKSTVPWDKADSADQQRLIQEAIWSRFTPTPSADEDIQFDLEYDAFGYSNGKKGKDLSTVAARFEQWTTSVEQEYDKASDEVKQIVQKLAMIDDELSQEAWDVSDELNEKNQILAQLIEDDHNGSWTNLRNNLRGDGSPAAPSNSVEQTNSSLTEETTLLEKIQKLTTYIDDNYLSSGKHLSDFLDDIQRESNELDTELKEILTTLNLIDNKGNLTFDVKRNGEAGGGTTHNGALISDDFVLIERGDYDSVKNSQLPGSTQNAAKDGVNVAEVLGYLPSKHNGGFFDVQGTAKGHNLFENGVISQDVVNATEDQLEQLVQAFIKARDYGFDIENGGSNIVYDKEKGFSFYDLEELSVDDAEFWNSKTEAEKKLIALENLFSLFSGLNRDHANFANDANVGGFAERIKGVVESKNIIPSDAVDEFGRNYEDIYDDVFSGNIDDEYNDVVGMLQAAADAHKQNAAAIKEEEQAQEELNQSFLDGVLASAQAKANIQDVEVDTEPKTVHTPDVTKPTAGDEMKASIGTEELRNLLSAITYNVKVVQDAEPAEDNKVSIDESALENVLNRITYNVKLTHDDADKTANKIAIDESVLESTLKRVFTNILNPNTEQNDSEPKNEPWALEKTLLSVKEVLDGIYTNTTKTESIEVAPTNTDVGNVLATENTLAAIKTAVESINSKVVKGTKTKTSEGGRDKTGATKKNAESYDKSRYFPEKLKTQTMQLAKFRAQLMTTGKLTDDVDAQIYELLDGLKQVQNGPDFSAWMQKFQQLKTSVGITDIFDKAEGKEAAASYEQLIEFQKIRNKLELQYEKAQDGSALKQFYAEQLAQMDSVIAKQEEMLENEEYELKLAKMQEEHTRKLGEAEAKAADKDAKKQATAAKKLAQREAMLGKTGSAVGRAESTWINAVGIEGDLPAGFTADIDEYYQKLDALRKKHQELKNSDMISEEQKQDIIAQTMEINKMTEEIGELVSEYQRLSGDNASVIGMSTLGSNVGLGEYEQQLKQAVMTATNGKAQIKNFDAATRTLTYTVKTGKNEFTEYTAAVRRADGALVSVQGTTKRTETFLEATKRKMKEISSYMSGMSLISRAGQELRRGIQYVREIDLALTELKKVTDETEESYDKFLETAAKTADKVGSTIQKVVSSTADWARLGYSMEQAAKFAESTQVLMNVSEFTDVSQATDTLISSVQAFGYTAETSMEVVDLLNTIGNNYAISTADLAQSLTKSSASLVAAGGDLAEAAALTATANAIIQDADAVGTALKTTSLRLRGTDVKVLEEEGVDSDGAVTSKSKLQSKVKALSGVDILTETGDYKSTYEILSQIADVWEDISNMDQAALLELLAGKRNASVLAAILQNPEQLKTAYEDAQNAAGSAWEENEKYLDSIQGKIDQFNNAMQSMWSNTLDSDMVKGFVELGTEIIKIIDKIGLLNTALITLATYSMIKNKTGPIAFLGGISDLIRSVVGKVGGFIGSLTGMTAATSAYTAETLSASVANGALSASEAASIATKNGLALATTNVTAAEATEMLVRSGVTQADALAMVAKLGLTSSTQALSLADIQAAVSAGTLTAAQGTQIASALGLTAANTGLTASFGALWTAIWPILAAMAAVALIYGVVKAIDAAVNTTEELTEELDELKTELQDIQSELESVNSELKTTEERMAELLAKDALTFTEEEELKRLKAENDELQRKLDLLHREEQLKKEETTRKFNETMNSANSDEYYITGEKKSWWNYVADFFGQAFRQSQGDYNDYSAETYSLNKLLENKMDAYEDYAVKLADIETRMVNAGSQDEYNQLAKEKKQIEDNMYELQTYIQGKVSEFNSQAEGLEYFTGDNLEGWQIEANKHLDTLNNLRDKWAIAQGDANVKSSAITRIFNKEEYAEASDTIDDLVKQLAEDPTDQTVLNKISEQCKLAEKDLLAVGLSVEEATKHFAQLGSKANYDTLEGKIAEVSRAAASFESLLKGGLFKVDGDNIGLASLFDQEGKIIQSKLSQVFQHTSDQTREDITRLLEGSYEQIKNGTVDVGSLLSGFALKTTQQILKIQNKILGDQNLELFPNLKDEIDGIIDKFEEFSAAVGSVVDAMDTLEQARKEEAYSGSISIETLENLMQYTDDYSQLVEVDETGAIRLAANAEQILIEQRIEKIKTDAAAAVQTAQTNLEQAKYNAKAVNETGPVQRALTSVTDALAGAWAYLGSIIGDVTDGNFSGMFERASSAYSNVTAGREQKRTQVNISVEDAEAALERALDQQKIANAITSDNIKKKYSSDEASGENSDSAEDAFQREMDYWENRISANQARYEQIQNEIDLLESQGKKAGAEYYEEQIKLEEERLWLLEQQKAAAESYLSTFTEGSDEWWDVANELNDIESEIDDVTKSVQDLNDAIAEVNWYKFEEPLTRFDNHTDTVSNIRDLIAPNGEEDWFDDEGMWTEKGAAVAGTYIQEIEMDKASLKAIQDPEEGILAKLSKPYEGNEEYYKSLNLGIDSEQDLYDKRAEYQKKEQGYLKDIQDNQQNLADMYKSQIDAIEEYTQTLVDGYNDYIDSVKEALDAERDLYEFKKNVQKQAKDIAEIERRIASLSGSTNAADIAERRKLEADLYDSRESLNDTYYEHARDSRNNALDAEASAYEETMNRFVQSLRDSLDTALLDMNTFMTGVYNAVILNAPSIMEQYDALGLSLDSAITDPWKEASDAIKGYQDGDGENLGLSAMNSWVSEGGIFPTFETGATDALTSPWSAGQGAVDAFKQSVDTQMGNVVSAVNSNVAIASQKLSELYKQIEDTEKRATEADATTNNNGNHDPPDDPPTTVTKTAVLKSSGQEFTATRSATNEDDAKKAAKDAVIDNAYSYYRRQGKDDSWLDRKYETWSKAVTYRAKGTTGITRDEWAITDEPQFGDELVLVPGKDGNLSFMRKGTGVVPADLTRKLFELAQIPTSDLMNKNMTAIVPNITKNDFKNEFNFESLVHVDTVDSDTLPKLEKMVDKKIDDFSKALNYSIKRFAR